jgi:chromosome segregation ATPase
MDLDSSTWSDISQQSNDKEESKGIAASSQSSVSASLRFELLQDEIAILKEELKASEDSYHSKRAMLEEEAQDNRLKYKEKVGSFQTKFAALADETRRNETKYATQVQQVSDQLKRTEQAWWERLEQLESTLAVQKQCHDEEIVTLLRHIRHQTEELQSVREGSEQTQQALTQEYQFLHRQLEQLQRTSEKRHGDTEAARRQLEQAQAELVSTLHQRTLTLEQVQQTSTSQASDIQVLRSEAGADKEELELMIQSWITQHEQLNTQVQQQAQQWHVTQQELQSAATERDGTRQSVQKLGQTWETLFEHLVEQVQDQASEHRALAEQCDGSHQALSDKLATHRTAIDEQFWNVEQRGDEQGRLLQTLQATSGKHTSEIATLSQSTNAASVRIAAVQTQLHHQSKEQAATNTNLAALQGQVSQLATSMKERFGRVESTMDSKFSAVTAIQESLQQELVEQSGRIETLQETVGRHENQLDSVSVQIHTQRDQHAALEQSSHDRNIATHQMLGAQQSNLDALSDQLQSHAQQQSDWRDAMQVALASQSNSTEAVDHKVDQVVTHVSQLETRLEQQAQHHETTRGDLATGHDSLVQRIAEGMVQARTMVESLQNQAAADLESTKAALTAELKEHQTSLTVHDAKLMTFGPQIQQLVHQVSEQGTAQTKASEAHALIRDDLQQLRTELDEQDSKLRSQLEDQTISLNGRLGELHSVLDSHDQRHGNLEMRVTEIDTSARERQETAVRDIESKMEEARARFQELQSQVQEHAVAHTVTNADCTAIKADLLQLAGEMKDETKTISSKIEQHVTDLKAKHHTLSNALSQQVAEHQSLDLKLEKYNAETQGRHNSSIAELTAKMNAAQAKFIDLQSKVHVHDDDLKISKEARVVIRQDLKTLMTTMNTQDGAIRQQIEETATFVNEKRKLFKSMLAKLEARQVVLDKKVELFNAAAREQHERLNQECETKISEVSDTTIKRTKFLEERLDANARAIVESQTTLQQEFSQRQAEGLMKATTAMHTTLSKHRADKAEIEKKLESLRATLSESVGSRVQAVEVKVGDCKSQFEQLMRQVESHSDKTNVTQTHVDMLKDQTERLTEIQTTQFEHLLSQLSQQGEELVSVKAVLPNVANVSATAHSAEHIQSLADRLECFLQSRESAVESKEDSTTIDMVVRMDDVQQQLKQLQASLEHVQASRERELLPVPETADDERDPANTATSTSSSSSSTMTAWSEQLERAVAQIQQQAQDLAALREDRSAMHADTNAKVEQLQLELSAVTSKMAWKASEMQRERDERLAMEQKLQVCLSENESLSKKVVRLKTHQQKYKSDFSKRQGLLKTLMSDETADIPRDVCFSILEEESRATTEGSVHSYDTQGQEVRE